MEALGQRHWDECGAAEVMGQKQTDGGCGVPFGKGRRGMVVLVDCTMEAVARGGS